MRKKIFTLLLVGTTMTALIGCGTKKENPADTTGVTGTESEAGDESAEEYLVSSDAYGLQAA